MKKAIAGVVLWGTLMCAVGHADKISPDLRQAPQGSIVNVIVQRKAGGLVSSLLGLVTSLGGKVLKDVLLLGGQLIQIPVASLDLLAASPDVVYISPDRPVSILSDHYEVAVNAPAAWNLGLNGAGVAVAVIDSGVSAHADLRLPVYSQIFNGTRKDGFGHGTHVAGIIAGRGTKSNGAFVGIAQGVDVIDLQVLDENGGTTDSVVIEAIERAIQLKNQYKIRVINLSLGRPVMESYTQDPLCLAVEKAWKAGIVVVVAAGNSGRSGYGTILSPANDPYVITVGAMKPMETAQRSDDQIASYSSKGPTAVDHIIKPDLVAPGNRVVSLAAVGSMLATASPQNLVSPGAYGPQYMTMNGTSMAAPMVSAAAALLLQQDRSLTPDTVKARLMKTAYKAFPASSIATDAETGAMFSSYYDIFTVGAGYLDIHAALTNRETVSGATLSPVATFNPLNGKATLVPGLLATFAKSGKWDAEVVWSRSVLTPSSGLVGGLLGGLTGNAEIWGTRGMWEGIGTRSITGSAGTSAMWATSAMWGSSAMWGTAAMWGSSAMWGTSACWGNSVTTGGDQ